MVRLALRIVLRATGMMYSHARPVILRVPSARMGQETTEVNAMLLIFYKELHER